MRTYSLIALTITLTSLLIGCTSSTSPIQYYLLANTDAVLVNNENTHIEHNEHPTLITLQSVQLAAYLSQSSIVIEQNEHKLHYSSQHYWAQDLEHEVSNIVKHSINKKESRYIIIDNLDPRSNLSELQLKLSIEHLLPTQRSGVVLIAEYWIVNSTNHKVIATERVNLTLPLEQSGYPHAIKKMGEAVVELSRFINQKIQSSLTALEN